MDKKILIAGSLNMDIVINMSRMPVIGETVFGDGLAYIPGGKGANQACAAGRLGGHTLMLGCVGQDDFGSTLKQSLADCGVDSEKIRRTAGPTGTASIYVNSSGDNSIVVIPGATHDCDVDYLKEMDEAFRQCTYVLLQMEIPMEAVCYAIRRAKELGKVVILNPAPAPDFLPEEILPMSDYLTPYETELMKVTNQSGEDMDSIREGACRLCGLGIKNVIVTMGKQGSMLVSGNEAAMFPARKVVSVDTTAAGDCFNGAFVVALSEGKPVDEAIRFANLASSVAVTRDGAQKSLPSREEVEQILAEPT